MVLLILLNILKLWMIYQKIEDYNKKRKRKVLIVNDDMISHVISDKMNFLLVVEN